MGLGIEDIEQKCLECGRLCKNKRSLGNHIVRTHEEVGDQKGYVLKYLLNGEEPKCKCGCGKETSWHKRTYQFNDYVNGHNKSGFIGFRHTPEQIEKRNNSIRQTYKKNKKELSDKIGRSVSNAFKDPKKNQALREGQRRGWSNAAERKTDLTRRNLEMLAQGLIGPQAPFKTEWKLNPFTGKDEYMHSSWESAFLDTCISRSYPVTKDHGITIPYRHPDGSTHTYVPDFYAFEDRVLYEVKGRHDETDVAKWEAAEEWCGDHGMSFQCLFSDDIDT